MNWQRLERWVTISFGVAAGIAVIIQLTKRFAPEVWFLHRLARDVADYLDELGDIGSGVIIVVFLSVMGGSWVMTVLLRGIEKLHEMRQERRRIREEGRMEGRKEGRMEGREEGRREMLATLRSRLMEMGHDPDEILPLGEGESEIDPFDYG